MKSEVAFGRLQLPLDGASSFIMALGFPDRPVFHPDLERRALCAGKRLEWSVFRRLSPVFLSFPGNPLEWGCNSFAEAVFYKCGLEAPPPFQLS